MINPKDITEDFFKILHSDPTKLQQAYDFLIKEMDRLDCKFGKTIVPVFLRPIFILKENAQKIALSLKHFHSILEKISQLYFTNPELEDYYCLDEPSKKIIEIDHGYSQNVVIARPDSFLGGHVPQYMEFNCDSPAGPGYCDVQEDVLLQIFPVNDLKDKYLFEKQERSKKLLKALLAVYQEFGGQNKNPNIAIVDWRDVKTRNEFNIIKRIFIEQGYQTILADPRDLKFKNNRLEHNGFPIDIIYRRVIFKELVAHLDEVQDFLLACKNGRVCVANPFRSRLVSNKSILAIMTNLKEYKGVFTEKEVEVIQDYVPWTRRVLDQKTDFQNQTILMKDLIRKNKDLFVLKPADSYGGKNVTIGTEHKQSDWDALISQIIDNKENWVVQQKVAVSETEVPIVDKNNISFTTKKYNINPFVLGGEYAGTIARYSDWSVINVTAGGGMVPVIEYENKV